MQTPMVGEYLRSNSGLKTHQPYVLVFRPDRLRREFRREGGAAGRTRARLVRGEDDLPLHRPFSVH